MTEPNDGTIPFSAPFEMFVSWMDLAAKNELNDFNAMTLATVGPDGTPSLRVILLKGYDPDGLLFYSGHNSRKAQHLLQNPKAAVQFYWKTLRRQVSIEGIVSQIDDADSDSYFASRSRNTQISAWASLQSKVITDDLQLEQRIREFEDKFKDQDIPRPPYWSGFRLVPLKLEFWQENNDPHQSRILFTRQTPDSSWIKESLYP